VKFIFKKNLAFYKGHYKNIFQHNWNEFFFKVIS